MNKHSSQDPRIAPDFDPNCFPLANGDPLPMEEASELQRLQLSLACAYYLLNRAYAALCEFRDKGAENQGDQSEYELLQEIEKALIHKENQEDALAQQGICATPTIKEGIVVDLAFCAPTESPKKTIVAQPRSSSVTFDF